MKILDSLDYEMCLAFLSGLRDGYERGQENNQFNDAALRHAYRAGYDKGVFYYSEENEERV